jgi:hypothetical protein
MDLECGHTLSWVAVGERMPFRKRCQMCELIQTFSLKREEDYAALQSLTLKVPPEDRPRALLEWITHYLRAENFQKRIPDLDFFIAMRITDEGSLYPLPLDEDDWKHPCWQSE